MKKVSFWPIWDEIQKVREKEWFESAIKLANEYIAKDPFNIQSYMQLIDMYYLIGDFEKAEKPIDFVLSKNINTDVIDKWILYYVKAVLLVEKTQWTEAKKYIKLALKENGDNLEYNRLLAIAEFWSWNKSKWYELLKTIINKFPYDAEILLDWVTMALTLGYVDDAKEFVNLYFEHRNNMWFFAKSKSYYDKKMNDFKKVLFSDK